MKVGRRQGGPSRTGGIVLADVSPSRSLKFIDDERQFMGICLEMTGKATLKTGIWADVFPVGAPL